MATLITGADGALGRYLDFGIRTNRSSLDITRFDDVRRAFETHRPTEVLHVAAVTDMGQCETNPGAAFLTNAAGTYHLALACREFGARMVYVSSAGVFDGNKQGAYTENDMPSPPNVYGHSKYLGELAVRSVLENYLIVRTCWIFGGGPEKDKKFVGKIMAQLKVPETKIIKGTNDEFGMPTYGKDLAAFLKRLLTSDERGVVHGANAGVASRYEVAKFIVSQVAPNMPVEPISLSSLKLTAGVTKNQELSSRIGLMRPWQESLKEYLMKEWLSE